MTARHRACRSAASLLAGLLVAIGVSACGPAGSSAGAASARGPAPTLTIGAIPDQDPEKLQRLYGVVADYLSGRLGVKVVYRPVTDYAAAVSLFRTGDLQLVWFGGLTGVQAATQTPGSVTLVQRDVDASFHSLFIANTSAHLRPVTDTTGLSELKGERFTYGSQSSTSGYLMPAYYLRRAGVDPARGFAGDPGFSGSHDKTIDLVASGTYQAGAVNEQVWKARAAAGTVDRTKVSVLYRTPAFSDYHWLLGPTAVQRFGPGFAEKVSAAFEALDPRDPTGKQVLDLFSAQRFVPTAAANYDRIRQIGRQLGLLPAA